jgi:hypothetical protein
MLHTLAAQDAFQQTTLQQRLNTLTDTEQQLEQQVQTDSAPAALEARARALGMVPSTIISYHRRPNGVAVAHEAPITAVAPVVAATSTTTAPTTSPTSPSTKPAAQSTTTDSTKATSSSPQHHKGSPRP